ncbi:transposase [Streptomyces sp. NPDC021225]|uniref:transposase n=1 Tax=Streptomyces sp. NPDC021225 TaxID=3365121 RepID=UPI003790D18A
MPSATSDDACIGAVKRGFAPPNWGRSRGGLSSKVHLSADRRCRPLSFVLTPGQAADSPRFTAVLERIKVRGPVGRPRTRPAAVAADKAYSSRANRAYLRRRRIRAVIPEKTDQAANRKKRKLHADATVHVRDAKDVQGGRLSFVDRSRIAFDKICSGQPGHPVWRTSLEPGGGVRTDAGCGYDSAETHRCGGPRCFR